MVGEIQAGQGRQVLFGRLEVFQASRQPAGQIQGLLLVVGIAVGNLLNRRLVVVHRQVDTA